MDAIKQESERINQAVRKLASEEDEQEKEREDLKNVLRKVEEELSAIKSADDIPLERTETLASRSEELRERIDAFQKREEEIGQDVASLEEAIKKLSERATEDASQFKDANLELHKMLFEVFKLVATLDTGVLIAMTAIAVGLIPDPVSFKLFFLSCLFVFLSIVCSVSACLAQALLTTDVLYPIGRSTFSKGSLMSFSYWAYFLGSLGGLSLGIILFSQFVVRNLS